MNVPTMGYKARFREVTEAGVKKWFWELRYFGRPLGSGIAKTQEQAEKEAAICLGTSQIHKARKAYPQQLAQLKLINFVKRRPYMVMAVAEMLMLGYDDTQIVENAQVNEEAWYDLDKAPHKIPISKHPNALTSEEAAQKVLDTMKAAGLAIWSDETGWELTKLRKFVKRQFGSVMTPNSGPTEDEEQMQKIIKLSNKLKKVKNG